MTKLSEKEAQERLQKLNGWTIESGLLHKMYKFKGFRDAMACVVRIALIAEPMDHHPDIDIRYNKVILNLSTHSAGGLTEKDFQLASEIDAV